MTMVYLVPLIAYYVYRTLISIRVRGSDKSAGARLAIALSAYVVYIIFLDYRQPLRLWELLFGLLRRGAMQGEQVEAVGWYRRAPVPYIELKAITSRGKKRRCYVYHIKLAVAALLIAAGAHLLLPCQ